MFEKDLSAKLKRVFDLDKVTYDMPSDSEEQECLFISIATAKNQVKDGLFVGKVTGTLTIHGNSEKMPYGYFTKRLSQSEPADIKDLFLYNFEENKMTIGNITQRSADFIYLFSLQYDPNMGEITSLETIATVGNEQ